MATRLALLVCLLGLPALASAQIQVTESDQDAIVNIAECQGTTDHLTFNITVPISSTVSANPTITLVASNKNGCPTDAASGATNYTVAAAIAGSAGTSAVTAAFPASGTVSVNTVLHNTNLDTGNCNNTNTAVFFCATLNGTVGTTATSTGQLTLDLARPPPPQIDSVTPGDGALNVSWQVGTGSTDGGAGTATRYRMVATDPADPTHPHSQEVSNVTSGRVTGLTNGVTYDVTVIAITIGGNESDPSNPVTAAPIQINDFWRAYRQAGGVEEGGCATGAAGLAALVALVPLALRRRRRR